MNFGRKPFISMHIGDQLVAISDPVHGKDDDYNNDEDDVYNHKN